MTYNVSSGTLSLYTTTTTTVADTDSVLCFLEDHTILWSL